MKDFVKFASVAGADTGPPILDPQGSTQNWLLAEAVMANEPTSVLVEEGIIVVQKLPPNTDMAHFPILRNKNLTWSQIDYRSASSSTNQFGSDVSAQTLNVIEYKKVRPLIRTANIFLPDGNSLINKVTFDHYVQLLATDAARQKELDGLITITGSTNGAEASWSYTMAANSRTMSGSVTTGSTLCPRDLTFAKQLLSTGSGTGSNIVDADFVLMHPTQYEQLNTHADFAPGATARGAMMRKAKFNEDGDIVRFNGMDIIVSELVPAGSVAANTQFVGAGHWVLVGCRGRCGARAEHFGMKITSEDSRRFHGQWKIIDMSYAHDILVAEAQVLIRATDS